MGWQEFLQFELTPRFAELVQAPFSHPDMVWMTLPLLFSTLFMQFYFGRYKNEKLGWNTAFSNSLILFFVGLDSARYLVNTVSIAGLTTPIVAFKLGVVAFVVLYGLLLSIFDFFHKLPSKLAFIISSPMSVNVLAYLNMSIIYTSIPLDFVTLLAGALLFVIFFVCFNIIRWIMPEAS